MTPNPDTTSAGGFAGRYSAMQATRDAYLRRARRASELTLPYLIPPEGSNGSTPLPTPFQSIGARGVTTLTSKLLLTLLPPNSPFFKLQVDKFTLQKITSAEAKSQVDQALGDVERAVVSHIEAIGMRVEGAEMLNHLLVAGNALIKLPSGGKPMRVYPLTNYVCKRDPQGNLTEVVLKESVDPRVLPANVRQACDVKSEGGDTKSVDIYTRIWRTDGGLMLAAQEINQKRVPGAAGKWPVDKCPWLALRYHPISGEDYGRSFIDEYMGDLNSLERLMQSIVEAAAASAKVIFLVHPNATTKASDLRKTKNTGFCTGRKEDIDTLQVEKHADLRIASDVIQRLESRLAQAFMLSDAVQRQAERVTAEEIRFMASELDTALGGVYTVLAQQFQMPMVKLVMHDMTMQGKLPELPKGIVEPVIVTGMDALGRTAELMKLDQFLGGLLQVAPEIAAQHVNFEDYIRRRATALGIDTAGLIKTAEQLQQEQQQAQMLAMFQQFLPQVVDFMSKSQLQKESQQGGG